MGHSHHDHSHDHAHGPQCKHGGHGGHHHHHHIDVGAPDAERSLFWAVVANMLLTLGQIAGGIVSGSLSLVADALHNFSDAASLLIAWVAIRIGKRPANEHKTFGYRRAETIAALINVTSLLLIGAYLVFEAIQRFFMPAPVVGWMMIAVAGLALAVDAWTALLTWRHSKTSMNMRAAFLHNLTDALASVGVIAAGGIILLTGWNWVDAALTLVIAGYVLYHGAREMPRIIHLLMDGAPEGLDLQQVLVKMKAGAGVEDVHHVHVWQMDEERSALEAHVVIADVARMDAIRDALKDMLRREFRIDHSTLEFETAHCGHGTH